MNWFYHLPNQSPINWPQPLASFHSRSLIVAVGDGGAEILLRLNNHLCDTQLSMGDPLLSAIHLALPQASNNNSPVMILNQPVQSLTLVQDRTPPPLDPLPLHWNWLTKNTKDASRNPAVLSRRSARVIFYNHLSLGIKNSILAAALSNSLKGTQFVYLVAAAADFSGASLINDLAVMIQRLKVNIAHPQCVVIALIAGHGEQPAGDMANMRDAVGGAISASMYEIARASTETFADFIYSNDFQYHPLQTGEREPLLSGSAFFVAEDNHFGRAYSQIVHTLWAALTCREFATGLSRQLRQRQRRTRDVNFVFAYKVAYPLRILKTIYTEHLMLRALGNDQNFNLPTGMPPLPPHPTQDQLRQTLSNLHSQGLLPTIAYLRDHSNGADSLTYYGNILGVLHTARQQSERNLRAVDGDIRTLYRQAENDLVYSPLADPNQWLNLAVPGQADHILREAYEEMQRRIGWVTRVNDLRYPVQLIYQDSDGTPQQVFSFVQGDMQRYVEAIRNLAERIASGLARNAAVNFPQALNQNDLRDAWNEQLQRGPRVYQDTLWTGVGDPPTIQHFNINVPTNWNAPNIPNMNSFDGNDSISALQVTVISGTPLENTRQVIGRLADTYSLVYEPEVYTFNIFGSLDNVPLLLQNLLTHTNTMEQFCKCLAHSILDDSMGQDWEKRLLSFMRQYESDPAYRMDISTRLAGTLPLPQDQIETRLPDNNAMLDGHPDLFARALRQVITSTLMID